MTTPQPRQLWAVTAPNRMKRIMLVTAATPEFVTVMLTHPYDECGTDHDAWFPNGTVRPYPVWVQTDLRGVVAPAQCVAHLATLTPAQAAHVADVAAGRVLGDGLRLAGPVDPRWQFKLEEGATLAAFTADATVAALGGAW